MPQNLTLCAALAALTLLPLSARAEDAAAAAKPKLKGTVKKSAPKIELGMPAFDKPTDSKLQKATEKAVDTAPRASNETPSTVVSVINAKTFTRSGQTIRTSPPIDHIAARGDPLMTETFVTVVKVKQPSKRSTAISVKLVDPRGDTVLESEGELVFRSEELEWTVEWEASVVRAAGEGQMQVRFGSQPPVNYPLKIEAHKNE